MAKQVCKPSKVSSSGRCTYVRSNNCVEVAQINFFTRTRNQTKHYFGRPRILVYAPTVCFQLIDVSVSQLYGHRAVSHRLERQISEETFRAAQLSAS